jgi:hypothetical protein
LPNFIVNVLGRLPLDMPMMIDVSWSFCVGNFPHAMIGTFSMVEAKDMELQNQADHQWAYKLSLKR